MHSGFSKLRESMSFNLCFLPSPPAPSPEALAEAAEVLRLWEDALHEGGPWLCGDFSAADILFAPVVVRLTAFQVPAASTPRAAAWMKGMLEHPLVRRWMDPARALQPVERH